MPAVQTNRDQIGFFSSLYSHLFNGNWPPGSMFLRISGLQKKRPRPD